MKIYLYAEINTAGIPNNITRTLILDIKFNENYFERAIHHEVFHMINDSYKELFDEKSGKHLIKEILNIASALHVINWNLELYNNKDGFFTEYSKSTASEDMAEIFSHLMFYKNKIIL